MDYKKNKNHQKNANGSRPEFKKNSHGFDKPRGFDKSHSFEREELDETVVIGRNAVRELLLGGRDVDKLYITSGEREGSINQLLGIAAERGIPITECDRTKLDSIAKGGRHQGVIAIAAERNYSSIEDILSYAEQRGEPAC